MYINRFQREGNEVLETKLIPDFDSYFLAISDHHEIDMLVNMDCEKGNHCRGTNRTNMDFSYKN